MHNFAVGLRKRSVYSWILQRELNSACHSDLSLFLWNASSLVLICSVGTPRSHFFFFFPFLSSSSLFYKSCTSLFLVFSGCLNSIHLYDLGKRNACRLRVIIIYATWYELAYAYVWNSDFS